MESHFFGDDPEKVTTAILIKDNSFDVMQLSYHYVAPLKDAGVDINTLCAIGLYYGDNNKVTAKEAKAYLDHLLYKLSETNVTTLVVADGNYFKYLAKVTKVSGSKGYAVDCQLKGVSKIDGKPIDYSHIKIILSTNYMALGHNINLADDLQLSLRTIAGHLGADGIKLGANVIEFEEYPNTVIEIDRWFNRLLTRPTIYADIEAFSLRFEKAGIGTLGFAWTKSEGIAFDVAHTRTDLNEINQIKESFKAFLREYEGRIVWHNLLYDMKVIIYTLFMKHDADWAGMREGLDIAAKHDDTLVLSYLATNNAVDNVLGLKELAYEYVGAYAEDVKDISLVPLPDLLTYNLKDCLATAYVDEKMTPKVIADNQMDYYVNMAKPSLRSALKMMLTGLPMDMGKVAKAELQIQRILTRHLDYLRGNKYVEQANFLITKQRWAAKNATLKKKRHPISKFVMPFNPNSDNQLSVLLYDVLKLPVLDTTDTGNPSTSAKVIKRLLDHEAAKPHLPILNNLIGFSGASIILSTFISAFNEFAFTRKTPGEFNNTVWLNGNLKTTGTKSGRLSSSEP